MRKLFGLRPWHKTLAEAKGQAEHEYAIADTEWAEVAG
jgi:hypothetical protein